MSKLRSVVLISFFSVFSVSAAVGITLTGTVKNGEGTAIDGAVVSLHSDSLIRDTTTATGAFTLNDQTALRDGAFRGKPVYPANGITINGSTLRFTIATAAEQGAVAIHSGNGRRSVLLPLGKMSAGVQLLALPELAPGFYIVAITINKVTTTLRLVQTGDDVLLSNQTSGAVQSTRLFRNAATGAVDTIVVKKDGFTTVKHPITSYTATDIAVVMQKVEDGPVYDYAATVENSSIDCTIPTLPESGSLTKNTKFPDPFKKLDGTYIKKKSEWRCRRAEILAQAMKYIYGDKPAPPEEVTGKVTNTSITVHVKDKGKEIEFTASIKLPSTGTAPYPAIIAMGGGGQVTTKAASQGVAVITYNYGTIGKEQQPEGNVDRNKDFQGLFYDIYGGKHSAGLLMAWSWGASRMIDVLQKFGGEIIDYRRLAVTGCSRAGKGAFAVGLFDERIALILPEETSLGGIVGYRIADAKCPEKTDSNFKGQLWFSNNFKPFVSNTSLLPIDAHALIATVAPRGFYGMENSAAMSMAQQMCPGGGNMAVQGASDVYKALGCGLNISYNSTGTDKDHCGHSDKLNNDLAENVKKFLLHQAGTTGKIEAGTTYSRADWIDWTAPTLEDDTDLYDTK